jgi:hypothetical protein
MALAEPFSREPLAVWVPWRQEFWFWPRYELFFSGFGPLFTILVCAIPYCLYRFRDRIRRVDRSERFVFCMAALIAALLIMPLQFRPVGFFGGLPRFIAFIIPAVMACSLAPLVERLRDRPVAARACLLALAIYFSYEAFECGYRDRFSPWIYAKRIANEPGARWILDQPVACGQLSRAQCRAERRRGYRLRFRHVDLSRNGRAAQPAPRVHFASDAADPTGRAVGDGRPHLESHLAKPGVDGHEQSVRGDVCGAAE